MSEANDLTTYDEALKERLHLRLAIHIFLNQLLLTDLPSDDVFRILGNQEDLEVDSFWPMFRGPPTFRGTIGMTCSAKLEEQLKRRYPLDTLDYPTITMAHRSREIKYYMYSCTPREVANYLGFESFEIAYPTLGDESKRELIRIALNRWGFSSGIRDTTSDEWQNTLRRLFALGARLEMLGSGDEKEERLGGAEEGVERDEAVVQVLRLFVLEYFLAKIGELRYYYRGRDVAEGFECFLSKTERLGIKLGASSSCKRFEICIDDGFVYLMNLDAEDCCWEPHDFGLHYDEDLLTWVMWDLTYEKYCGEFWDLIDHPERTMPGTWVD